ncbi:MAG: hypothetical protein NTX75_00135 [Proteobacteria bacterium]|nr:hypothetical protein [Pseudomonadota bacterium]
MPKLSLMSELFHTLNKLIGIDNAIAVVVAQRFWSIFSGPFTMFMICTYLLPSEQGYYYTFFSILALQVFMELGLSQSVIQFTSHEFARLQFNNDRQIEGESASAARLHQLSQLAVAWYAFIALLFFFFIGAGGWYFFSVGQSTTIEWQKPWVMLVMMTSVGILISPLWFILEGCNRVAEVNLYRFIGNAAASIVMWIVLFFNLKLYAVAVSAGILQAVGASWLLHRYGGFILWILKPSSWVQATSLNLFKEVWPFQWRISISWLCGYFIFNIFNPILFKTHGELAAGRFGITMQAVGAVSAVAISWTQTKVPQWGMWIKEKRYDLLDRSFKSATWRSAIVGGLGGGALIIALILLNTYTSIGNRFAGIIDIAMLAAVIVPTQIIAAEAFYLRAHKREPFMWLSVINALLMALAVSLLIPRFGVWGAALSYTGINTIMIIPATFVFFKMRRQWHKTDFNVS